MPTSFSGGFCKLIRSSTLVNNNFKNKREIDNVNLPICLSLSILILPARELLDINSNSSITMSFNFNLVMQTISFPIVFVINAIKLYLDAFSFHFM